MRLLPRAHSSGYSLLITHECMRFGAFVHVAQDSWRDAGGLKLHTHTHTHARARFVHLNFSIFTFYFISIVTVLKYNMLKCERYWISSCKYFHIKAKHQQMVLYPYRWTGTRREMHLKELSDFIFHFLSSLEMRTFHFNNPTIYRSTLWKSPQRDENRFRQLASTNRFVSDTRKRINYKLCIDCLIFFPQHLNYMHTSNSKRYAFELYNNHFHRILPLFQLHQISEYRLRNTEVNS